MLVATSSRKVEALNMDKKAPKKPPKPLEPWQIEDAGRLKKIYEKAIEPVMSQTQFGDTYEIGSPSMVWQYLSGHRPLNIRAAVSFAKGLGCKIEDFSPSIAADILEAASFAGGAQPGEMKVLTAFRLGDEAGCDALNGVADSILNRLEKARRHK